MPIYDDVKVIRAAKELVPEKSTKEKPYYKDPGKGARLVKQAKMKEMVQDAVKLIKAAKDKASSSVVKDANDFKALVKKWFGPPGQEQPAAAKLTDVRNKLTKLYNYVATTKNGITFRCVNVNDIASCDHKTDDLTINLGNGFTWTRYSWGEKVCTIIHEISHKDGALGTDDKGKYNDGGDAAYGARCIALAEQKGKNADAILNADNWAYFVCEFRDKSKPDAKWKFFTKFEIEARKQDEGRGIVDDGPDGIVWAKDKEPA